MRESVRDWALRCSPSAVDRYRRLKSLGLHSRPVHVVRERLGLRQRAFERAYATGVWTTTGESLSGDGSSMAATAAVRAALPDALRALEVHTLLDVPCGDWNWMSRMDLPVERYIGGDLVPSVVGSNQRRFGDDKHEFRVLDLCVDLLPDADLLLCRDAWVHFSYADIWRAIENIARARIQFLATTTFPETSVNIDSVTGISWRHLNLQTAPFEFPAPLLTLPEGYNRADQVLCVWPVSVLQEVLAAARLRL